MSVSVSVFVRAVCEPGLDQGATVRNGYAPAQPCQFTVIETAAVLNVNRIGVTSSTQNGRSLQIYRRATSSNDDIARHIRSDFPANSPMPEHWQVIVEVENGVAVAPKGRSARIRGAITKSAEALLAAGCENRLFARTGVAKRKGHCLLWVVSSRWHPARGEWTNDDSPRRGEGASDSYFSNGA
ncbi:MAG: hypothetical protein EA424_16950 [Planctomycetaceae bacterium]|nr:MAG: hypothetical protein EA424_16950 [Planctomycetaceae bacterium]